MAGDAIKLPRSVKKTINNYVRNENNHVPPTSLCDEGWRQIYKDMVKLQTEHLNSPKSSILKDLFQKYVGVSTTHIDEVPCIGKLDEIITFRGEIVHQVKSATYVHIEDVKEHLKVINEIVIGIDVMIRDHIKNAYSVKVPWNDTYVHIT